MMQSHDLSGWTPSHRFDDGNPVAERGALRVLWLTLAMMLVEVWAGWHYNSMALLADGWHMSSHVLAMGLAVLAYALARRHADDHRFAFGTWKIEILGGFLSAVLLMVIAVMMAVESCLRFIEPQTIAFNQATLVAIVGLVVNLASAALLHDGHDHSHAGHHHADDHDHDHDHDHHPDLNHRSAYLHVLADAATSVLAIAALLGGKYLGWVWLDPLMGVAGSLLVGIWALGLLRDSGAVLLDHESEASKRADLLTQVQSLADVAVSDVHLWRVGRTRYACILALVTHRSDLTPDLVRKHLSSRAEIVHLTVEINHCGQCATPSATGLQEA